MQGMLKDPEGNVLLTMKNNNLYIIGRDRPPGDDHLNLEDLYVSRIHGIITCSKYFNYEDAGSRNGSRINGVSLTAGKKTILRDGDMITAGKTDMVFRIKKGKSGAVLPQSVRMRASAIPGGYRILIQASGKARLEYVQLMMERNPDPTLPVPVRTAEAEGDRLEYRVRDAVSMMEYFRQDRNAEEYRTVLEKMLRKILISSELLLDESGFLMNPETVFINSSGDILLLYLPCSGLTRKAFYAGLQEVFSSLEKECPENFRPLLRKLNETIEEGGGCWECYKILHCSGNRIPKKQEQTKKKEKKKVVSGFNPGTVLMILSFLAFLAVYWFADLSVTNLCGAALILAGLNVLAAGLRGEKRNSPGKHCRKKESFRTRLYEIPAKPFAVRKKMKTTIRREA